jgi:hypothetical protein
MTVSYVWHLPRVDADVRLVCLPAETEKMTAILDDIDGLSRSVRIEN